MHYLRSLLSFHPATVLLTWLVLVALLTRLDLFGSAMSAATIVSLSALLDHQRIIQQVKRMRWLFFAAFISFSLTTPGEIVETLPWLTYEGLHSGVTQCLSLLMLLSLVVVLLRILTMDDFVAGLHVLAAPVALLGFDRQRFAVRLSMTITQLTQSSMNAQNANPVDRQTLVLMASQGCADSLSPREPLRGTAHLLRDPKWNDYLVSAVVLIAALVVFLQTSAVL